MKKIAKLPTILGLVILFVGLISGILLINSKAVFKLGAKTGTNPKNVRISNISYSSISVSWITDIKTSGFVKWGSSESSITKVVQDSIDQPSFTHHITILDIKPNTKIFIKINSDGQDWDNDGIAWQTKTSNKKQLNTDPFNISGSVVTESGESAGGVIVYVTVGGELFSTTTSANGNWFMPLSSLISFDTKKTILEINVDAGPNGSSKALIYPASAKNTPIIVLGKTYDFRTVDTSPSSDLPVSELSIPDQVEVSSRFEVEKSESQPSNTVTLDSINEGEIITTTDPEFFGTGPKDTEIEIIVESEAQTTTIQPNLEGSWSWNPPLNLEPGQHTVTVKWKNESGILRTITRNFVVSAAEGPAFESTPSATPTQTEQPTTTNTPASTSTPIQPTTTSSATQAPLPESGGLTPTLGLFIMGIGILTSSLFVFKTANG